MYSLDMFMSFLSLSAQAMEPYVNAGLTTFDMADIYGPAEDIFGSFYSQVWHIRCQTYLNVVF